MSATKSRASINSITSSDDDSTSLDERKKQRTTSNKPAPLKLVSFTSQPVIANNNDAIRAPRKNKSAISIRVFSIINIFLGFLSIILQVYIVSTLKQSPGAVKIISFLYRQLL